MYYIRPKDRKSLILAAMGKVTCDLKVENAKIVNVFTGEVLDGSVYVKDGFIAHVAYDGKDDDLEAKEVIDAHGRYLMPGLIDAHVHIESSMLTPYNFAKLVIPWGTTTVITDPHEIGNVLGVKGVRYMHDVSEDLPMRQFIDIPSSIPSVKGGLEYANAEFYKEEVKELSKLERVIGLAEVMDYLAVINAEDWMVEILDEALDDGLYLQAHAPGLSGKALSAYLCGGPHSDHETRGSCEAFEKMRQGMHIDARDSSMAKNVLDILDGIKGTKYYDTLSFCTDDRECDDILKHGHMNDVVNNGIAWGLDPVLAIKSASIISAREAEIKGLGAIAPGYVADMLIVDDLRHIDPEVVFFEGRVVARDHELVVDIKDTISEVEEIDTVDLKEDLSYEDFKVSAPIADGKVMINVMAYDNEEISTTHLEKTEMEVRDGEVVLPDGYHYVAVLNRYGRHNMAVHILKGFGMERGAVGSTVSHDCHNLCIVYKDARDAYKVAMDIKEAKGGMSAVLDQKTLYTLSLPLAGLMSLKEAKEFYLEAEKMKEADRKLGMKQENPLLRIATIALPVIPDVKMSDVGCIDVNTKTFIKLFDL